MAQPTKAAYYTEFGEINKIQVGNLDLPEVGAADVQLPVKAAGVNSVDAVVRAGKPT